jgi:hypothetical protein
VKAILRKPGRDFTFMQSAFKLRLALQSRENHSLEAGYLGQTKYSGGNSLDESWRREMTEVDV